MKIPFTRLVAIAACAAPVAIHAQNMVRNAGFEEIGTPVTTWDQLDHATGWSNANAGSCDLFQKDSKDKSTAIPDNELGSACLLYTSRCV